MYNYSVISKITPQDILIRNINYNYFDIENNTNKKINIKFIDNNLNILNNIYLHNNERINMKILNDYLDIFILLGNQKYIIDNYSNNYVINEHVNNYFNIDKYYIKYKFI